MFFMSKDEIEAMSEEIKFLQEKTGISKPEIFALFEARERNRIADALEKLAKCTDGHVLYITGDVSADVTM